MSTLAENFKSESRVTPREKLKKVALPPAVVFRSISATKNCHIVLGQHATMTLHLTQSKRLQIVIFISLCFFITEISSSKPRYSLLMILC